MDRRKLVSELKRKLDEVKQCNDDDLSDVKLKEVAMNITPISMTATTNASSQTSSKPIETGN